MWALFCITSSFFLDNRPVWYPVPLNKNNMSKSKENKSKLNLIKFSNITSKLMTQKNVFKINSYMLFELLNFGNFNVNIQATKKYCHLWKIRNCYIFMRDRNYHINERKWKCDQYPTPDLGANFKLIMHYFLWETRIRSQPSEISTLRVSCVFKTFRNQCLSNSKNMPVDTKKQRNISDKKTVRSSWVITQ